MKYKKRYDVMERGPTKYVEEDVRKEVEVNHLRRKTDENIYG